MEPVRSRCTAARGRTTRTCCHPGVRELAENAPMRGQCRHVYCGFVPAEMRDARAETRVDGVSLPSLIELTSAREYTAT